MLLEIILQTVRSGMFCRGTSKEENTKEMINDKTYIMRRDRNKESQSNTLDDFVMMRFNTFTSESC